MARKTVFLGDSITEGYGVSRGECWVDGLPEIAVNHGISGDTTGGMLRRFRAHVLAEHPDRVVIMGGLNDLGEGMEWEKVAENISAMCTWAVEEGIQPVIAICVEPDYDAFFENGWAHTMPGIGSFPQNLLHLNDWLRCYAKEQDLLCLDFAAEFPKRITEEYCRYFFDGEHPNRFGHAVLRDIARERLYK
jgi:lysophospholipase L1-like esterase